MPWEHIGDNFNGYWPEDSKWISIQANLAIEYLKFICGDPPEGCKLDMSMREHELGDYPTISLWWGDDLSQYPPMEYVNKCQNVYDAWNSKINWSELSPDNFREKDVDDESEVN